MPTVRLDTLVEEMKIQEAKSGKSVGGLVGVCWGCCMVVVFLLCCVCSEFGLLFGFLCFCLVWFGLVFWCCCCDFGDWDPVDLKRISCAVMRSAFSSKKRWSFRDSFSTLI